MSQKLEAQPEMDLEILTTDEVAFSLPGGIAYEDDINSSIRTVRLCGANCPDNIEVAQELLAAGANVLVGPCHGSVGGCAVRGALDDGAYATVPQLGNNGYQMTEVVIIPSSKA